MSSKEVREEEFRRIGNARSENSLTWAGFALTNFVTVVAIFSALGFEISVGIEVASGLFLLAGVCCASSWALYEAAGSGFQPKLKVRRFRKRKNKTEDQIVANPREIYVKMAEYGNLMGTLSWSAGVTVLLLTLKMNIAVSMWIASMIVAYLIVLPRYFKWRE